MTSPKKAQKTEAKIEKKRAKAEVKQQKSDSGTRRAPGSSHAVRYAEAVRGVLYVVTGVSFCIALVLGHRGVIISLDDLVASLFVARTGKIVLAVIGAAFVIYGLKHLRLVR